MTNSNEEYISREEIKTTLAQQFSVLLKQYKAGTLNAGDVYEIIFSEQDICDKLEPYSANMMLAREMQHDFMNFEIE